MAPSNKKRLLAMIGRPKKVATKRTRTAAAPTRAPAPAPPSTPARLLAKKQQEGSGNGLVDQVRDENDVVKFYSELFSSI